VKNINSFSDGDIALIDSSGKIILLYEIKSNHNVIMATEYCNCNCIMCPQPKKKDLFKRTDFNLKLLSLFDKDTKRIGITGGEPSLINDDLFLIINYIKNNLHKAAVTLLSNGIMFAQNNYALKLSEVAHPDLQVDIPIYSDVDRIHNEIVGGPFFYKTIKGLYNLALYKQKIGIRVVIHKMNYKRLPKLAEFIFRNLPFVHHVALMQMETIGLASENIQRLWVDPYEYNYELGKSIEIFHQRDMNVSIYNSQLCILPPELWKYSKKTISTWKNVFFDVCNNCEMKTKCGGLFLSAEKYHSKFIKNIVCNS
ncbi:MAG: His-Xaa-Ser system radical SAM maturase HxsC, partial [Ignavibacteriaceae bacterium]